jgi:hypothetical protein
MLDNVDDDWTIIIAWAAVRALERASLSQNNPQGGGRACLRKRRMGCFVRDAKFVTGLGHESSKMEDVGSYHWN